MKKNPKLTIAIITYKRPDTLTLALDAIRQNMADINSGDVEIVVSDNDPSGSQIRRLIGNYSGLNIKYFQNRKNVGGEGNVFLACARSTGAFILLHADDDLLCPECLPRLLKTIDENGEKGLITSSLEAFHERDPDTPLARLRFPSSKDELILGQGREAFERVFLRACSLSGLVIRRDLIELHEAMESLGSGYPQIYLAGNAARKAGAVYLAQPLMRLRLEENRRWQYTTDFMSGAIFAVLFKLTQNEPWGREAQRHIIRKRILAAYGPLFSAKLHAWHHFFKAVKGFVSVKEYRCSVLFWAMAAGIAIMGCRGIGLIRTVWRGPGGADVIV